MASHATTSNEVPASEGPAAGGASPTGRGSKGLGKAGLGKVGLGQALRLGVARDGVALLRSSRWRGAPLTLLAERACAVPDNTHGGADFTALALALDQVLAGADCAGWPLSVVLDDDLARLWQVAPPQGAARLADLRAAAAMRFQALYGEALEGWKMVAGWHPRVPFFGALPLALLDVLERGAAAHKLCIVGVVPHFVDAWNRWQGALKPDAWFGVLHGSLLTLGACEGGRLRAIRTLALPHGAEHYWLTQMLAREALLLDLAPPAQLQVCGPVPAAWRQGAANPANPAHPAHPACVALERDTPAVQAWPAAALLARSGSRA